MEESEEHYVELVETGEDAAEPLQPPEKPLDLVAAAIERAIEFPRLQTVSTGRNDGNPSEVQRQLTCLVVLVGAVHQQRQWFGQRPQAGKKVAAVRGVMGLAGGEGESYCRSSICGNQMNLGAPSSTRLADGLRAVFFSAPVPSGCTLTMVLSKPTASILMRTI